MTAPFSSFETFQSVVAGAPGPDLAARAAAEARNGQLTKPPGSLGRLEEIALFMAGWQGSARPVVERPQVVVFAGNHGVAARGVSAFPAEVTVQMVANFEAGGAAVNQLSRVAGAQMDVVALDLDRPTGDFTQGPAMSEADCVAALAAGWDAVGDCDLLVCGEMGIGNTTAAAALACALEGGAAADWCGRGTGVDDAGLAAKVAAVEAGVARTSGSALAVLASLGGREVAAMVGAYAAARVRGIPVLIDGFIATAAALVLERAVPGAMDHGLAAHLSAEGAHGRMLEALGKEPLLSLGLRLGEGSGAALVIGIVRAACACHSGMATFGEAGVSEG